MQDRMWIRIDESEELQALDRVRETPEAKRPSQYRRRVLNSVKLAVHRAVAVRETFEGEARQEVEILYGRHQIATSGDFDNLSRNSLNILRQRRE